MTPRTLPAAKNIDILPDVGDVGIMAVDAVTQIGVTAADALESAADAHERKAKADADRLRQLAATIRDQCAQASGHLDAFCRRAEDVVSTMAELSERVKPKPQPKIVGADDGAPIPHFLDQGPVIKGRGPLQTSDQATPPSPAKV